MTLEQSRAALAAFNADFNRRMEIQRAQESALLREQVDKDVWAMVDIGLSIPKICAAYGTKNWKTIKDIVDRKPKIDDTKDVHTYTEPCITIQYLDNGHVRVTAENFRDWTKTDQVASGGTVDILSTAPGLWAPAPNADAQMTPLRRELANAPLDAPLWRAMVDAGFIA